MSVAAHPVAHSHKRKEEHVSEGDIARLEAERKIARQGTLKMRLEELVCSLDISRALFDNGLAFHSYFSWTRDGIVPTASLRDKHASMGAYTSDELGQFLKIVQFSWTEGLAPRIDTYYSEKLDKFVCKIRAGHPLPNSSSDGVRELAPDEKAADERDAVLHFIGDTESDARGRLLVYLLQNGLFRKSDVPAQKAADVSQSRADKEAAKEGSKFVVTDK